MKCPYCGNQEIVWRGWRYNMKGKIRMRQCSKCRRKFTPGPFKRMRYSESVIMRAVSLYKQEKSSAKVKKRLAASGIKVSRWTIIKWARKFGRKEA